MGREKPREDLEQRYLMATQGSPVSDLLMSLYRGQDEKEKWIVWESKFYWNFLPSRNTHYIKVCTPHIYTILEATLFSSFTKWPDRPP